MPCTRIFFFYHFLVVLLKLSRILCLFYYLRSSLISRYIFQFWLWIIIQISIWSCFIEAFFRPEFFGGFHESSSFTTLGNTILKQKIICKLSMQNTLHASPYSFSTFQSSYHLTSKFQSSYCLTHLTECRHFKDDLTSIFKSSPNSNILKLALPNSPNWILI